MNELFALLLTVFLAGIAVGMGKFLIASICLVSGAILVYQVGKWGR